MKGDEKLRQALDAAMAIRLPTQFEVAWEAIQRLPNHSLRIVGRNGHYNCHAYGLRIEELPRYKELYRDRNGDPLAKAAFIKKLIEDGEIRILDTEKFGLRHVIIYFDDQGDPMHTARVEQAGKLLVSKWGGNELIEHGLWEVPGQYGNFFKVAVAPGPSRAMVLLEEWLPRIA